ncbi:RagB/SusD family nutrient uptake outer membrane protein [Longitalea luteola]|uniref:RagB/SusD family nutrient uptake outer membrane protein n=1 Tax=Longitalea luteola TaxID=2812563 RepID=UPI001A97B97F|nr:RagB/SusD family nutrient uptake outer membrane protein [Longitalea luteola]
MKNIIWFAIVVLTLSSCKKWLDVKPVSQVPESDLFNTAEGFEESLNGVYSRCARRDLYGFELTCGFPEVLAQNYSFPGADDFRGYVQTSKYNYKERNFIVRKDTAWIGLYHAIVNCNLLLRNLETRKEVLSPDRWALIKAEALALRAFLHFDVLRLFAPSFKSKPTAKAIPYVADFSNQVTPASTVTEVLTKIADDLSQAKELIRPVDPILTAAYKPSYPTDTVRTEELANTLFMQNRRHRMNYYAICAELARVNLYMEKTTEALNNALEVINSNKFPFTRVDDFTDPEVKRKDRIMYKELVFAWYIPQMADTMKNHFNTGLRSLFIEQNAGNVLYEATGAGGEDRRFKEWFKPVSGAAPYDWFELQKYLRDIEANRHYLMAPAIRLSEMYYIASECLYDSDPARAVALLKTVRFNRGITRDFAVNSKEDLLKELIKEARKEFFAEGQILYMYKRLNRAIDVPLRGSIPASDNVFVLPLPDNEIEFGNR